MITVIFLFFSVLTERSYPGKILLAGITTHLFPAIYFPQPTAAAVYSVGRSELSSATLSLLSNCICNMYIMNSIIFIAYSKPSNRLLPIIQ